MNSRPTFTELIVELTTVVVNLTTERNVWQQLATEYKEACRTASHYTEKMRRADERFEELSKP